MKFLRNSLLAGLLVVAPLAQANTQVAPQNNSAAWSIASDAVSITGNALSFIWSGVLNALKVTSYGSALVKKASEYPKVTLAAAGMTGLAVLYKKHIYNTPTAIINAEEYLKQIPAEDGSYTPSKMNNFLDWLSSFERCPSLTDVHAVRQYFNENMNKLELCHCAFTANETSRLSVFIHKASADIETHIKELDAYLKNASYLKKYLSNHDETASRLKSIFTELNENLTKMRYTASQVFGPVNKQPQQNKCVSDYCAHSSK